VEAKLYVGNLSYDTTENHLRELFMQAGGVVSIALIKDNYSGQPKGFAFVEMNSQADVQKAISMFNGYSLNERQLIVNFARPREQREGFRSKRGGQRQNRGGGGNRRY